MPMLLRANPPKKEIFEQDLYRPAKRVKTKHSPNSYSKAPRPYNFDLFPKLNSVEPRTRNSLEQSQSGSPSPASPAETVDHEPLLLVDTLDLGDLPADAIHQVTWVAELVQVLAQRMPIKEDAIPIILSSPKSCSIVCGPGFRPITFTGLDESVSQIKKNRLMPNKLEYILKPAVLDPILTEPMFAYQDGETDAERRRKAYGKLLVDGLRQGSYAYGQGSADELKATIDNTQDPFPFFAALEALANEPKVVHSLNQNFAHMKTRPCDSRVFFPLRTPDTVTNGEISSPTASGGLRSHSTGRTPPSSAISNIRESSPGFQMLSNIDGLPYRPSPGSDVKSTNFQNIVDRARRSVTADTLAARQQADAGTRLQQTSGDSITNMINRACFLMQELSTWQPAMGLEKSPNLRIPEHLEHMHRSNHGMHAFQANQGVRDSTALLSPRNQEKYPHRIALDKSHQVATMKRSSLPTTHPEQGPQSELTKKSQNFSKPKTIAKKANITITKSQIDDLLALANGGNLETQESDSETEPEILFDVGGTTTPAPETRIDKDVCSAFNEVVTGMTLNSSHGHDLSFQHPQLTHHPFIHYQRLASDLKQCIAEVKPRVNVAMSAERANATRALYNLLERLVKRSNGLSSQPPIPSAQSHHPTSLPNIDPPPGYEVRWHQPYASPVMNMAPHGIPDAPALVSNRAVLPSNPPPLPRLAPKPKQTSNQTGQTVGLVSFSSDPAAEARARLKKRIQSTKQMNIWALPP